MSLETRHIIAERIKEVMDMYDFSVAKLYLYANKITFKDNSQVFIPMETLQRILEGEEPIKLIFVKQIFMSLNCNWIWACSAQFRCGPKRSYRLETL